jgi:hypothetical protein
VTAVFVHVWAPTERIFGPTGRPDPHYRPDPTSGAALDSFAALMHGGNFTESQIGPLARALAAHTGKAHTTRRVETYARIALAPWFLLAGVVPLGFLLWRRNL